MDKQTETLVDLLDRSLTLGAQRAALDTELRVALREWSDTRPGAVGGGTATEAGARQLLTQAGVLPRMGAVVDAGLAEGGPARRYIVDFDPGHG